MIAFTARFWATLRLANPFQWLVLGLAFSAVGCSSSLDSTKPSATLKLSAIRQAPSGQLALVYDQPKPQPAGQRLYLVDRNVLGRNVSTALMEIKAHPGYGETFAPSVVVHRTYVHNIQGDEVFWVELDPMTLPGSWIPPLSQPALPTGVTEETLPAALHGSASPGLVSSTNSTSSVVTIAQTSSAAPNQHFIWMTADGPLETSVSSRTLFPPAYGDTWCGQAEKVIGGTLVVVGGLVYITSVVALDILIESHLHCR